MITVDEFSRLVAAIYASAVDPERWNSTLADFVRAFDGVGCGLLTSGPTNRKSDVMVKQIGRDPSALATYNAYYGRLDYVAEAVEKSPIGHIHTGTELILPNTNTEFYADWCRPNRFGDGLFVRLTGGKSSAWLGIAAPRGSEPFGTPDRLRLIRQLVPHLRQAIDTQGKLADLKQGECALSAAIEQVERGIVIVGLDGRFMHLNSGAERILASGDGLHLSQHGSIGASLARTDRELRHLMHLAMDSHDDRVPRGGTLSCPRPSGRCDYAVHVVPLAADTVEVGTVGLSDARAAVLIVIDDPDREPELNATVLRRQYALTGTESEVALRLAQGDRVELIAENFSVSITTVRTHLQHIFEKTGTHRQAELVRLLLS
ncbi:hypothetical protein FFI94_014000 [Rhodococcus sp. KBS0724]|uniref:helix-turn-helix transcriptional regulator n=1 Tax=Rhodococcus sp. KBS0724 TaxID=1179674 RepID=UPI00110E7FF4|nr:helix-turn-helix transcriptional regulator [Rhodococcus sp. KBS0724]TSD47157.1 hypothetical protein FFI94_014000 [Rhodococcus sp. KBS0724]